MSLVKMNVSYKERRKPDLQHAFVIPSVTDINSLLIQPSYEILKTTLWSTRSDAFYVSGEDK